jgi:hypothetical protein
VLQWTFCSSGRFITLSFCHRTYCHHGCFFNRTFCSSGRFITWMFCRRTFRHQTFWSSGRFVGIPFFPSVVPCGPGCNLPRSRQQSVVGWKVARFELGSCRTTVKWSGWVSNNSRWASQTPAGQNLWLQGEPLSFMKRIFSSRMCRNICILERAFVPWDPGWASMTPERISTIPRRATVIPGWAWNTVLQDKPLWLLVNLYSSRVCPCDRRVSIILLRVRI